MDSYSQYRIWFEASGFPRFELPVNPQEITISYPANTTNYDVEGLGEIIIPRKVKLRTFTLESFFPRDGVFVPFANSDAWYKPEWYVSFFRQMQVKGTPFNVTISRGTDQILSYTGDVEEQIYDSTSMKVVVLDFSLTDKGGEPGDVYYTISFSEYKDASPQTLAEIANETIDADDRIVSQELVEVITRSPQDDVIAAGTVVEINGRVYETEDENESAWSRSRNTVANHSAIVSRILPPGVMKTMHGVYVAGLGWVDRADCKMKGFGKDNASVNRSYIKNV